MGNKKQNILRFEIFELRDVIMVRETRKEQADDKLSQTPVFLLPVSEPGKLEE